MKLVLVISSLCCGGAERVLSDMANFWARTGLEVVLVTLSGEDVSDRYPLHFAVSRIRLGMQKETMGLWQKLRENARRILALRHVINETKADAVISFLDVTNILTLLATCGIATRLIVSERIDPAVNPCLGKPWKILRRWLYRRADAVVVQTEAAANWIRTECLARTVVIANALRELPNITVDREPFVLCVGRLDAQKGHDLVLQAFARVQPTFPQWRLVVLGEGPDRRTLEALRDRLSLQELVSMPGTVENPEIWMARAGFVVLASRFEGFPNVLLEAMGMGAAVISSNCRSGPADLIFDGRNGLLVAVDDVDALANAMTRLMADRSLREHLGTAARAVRQVYSQQVIMRKWNSTIFGQRLS